MDSRSVNTAEALEKAALEPALWPGLYRGVFDIQQNRSRQKDAVHCRVCCSRSKWATTSSAPYQLRLVLQQRNDHHSELPLNY